jgi:PAS domain S-box-containing protein
MLRSNGSSAPGLGAKRGGGSVPTLTTERSLLLGRARAVFGRFLLLAAGVQLLELVDAETAWWPDRTAALAGVAVVVRWGVRLERTGRATALGDLLLVGALTAIGLGLGRNGAVLVSLVAVLSLRALFGRRRDVAVVLTAALVSFGLVTFVHHGLGRVVDLGLLVVVVAAGALVSTLRHLGELLADHDLRVRLDEVATATAAQLVATTTTAEVALIARHARERIGELGKHATARGADEALDTVLRRLDGDLELARQRIASEARYRAVAEGNRDGVYLRDLGVPGSYRYLNPAAEEILGVTLEELTADLDVARRALGDGAGRVLPATSDGPLVGPVQLRWERPDGELRRISVHERTVTVDGVRRTALGTVRDVTREHREAQTLQRLIDHERAAAEELRHLDAMKSLFLQAVSHELRTPLSAVIGAAQTLDAHDDVLDPSQRRRMLDIVQRQSARLERLLTDLLDVDRLSRGLVAPDRAPTDLRDLAEGVVTTLEQHEADRIDVLGERVVVAVDGPKVERIVDNLLRNALRHTPAGGRITCAVTGDASGATLVVEDEGPGVPDELKTELFEPFAQGPSAQAAPSPGTGIGLALVRALAELHDGRAWIEDGPGGGARFVVELAGDVTTRSRSTDVPVDAPSDIRLDAPSDIQLDAPTEVPAPVARA